MLVSVLAAVLLVNSLLMHLGKWQMRTHVLGILHMCGRHKKSLLVPGFGLAPVQPWAVVAIWGVTSGWKISLSPGP